MTNQELIELSKVAHQRSIDKGFYDKPKTAREIQALIISEVGELVEAHRKERRANILDYKESGDYNLCVKGTIEEEVADIAIRSLDFLGWHQNKEGWKDFFSEYNAEVESELGFVFDAQNASFGKINIVIEGEVCELFFFMVTNLVNNFIVSNPAQVIKRCYELALLFNFDLDYHIHEKMKYNLNRPYLHGKKY